MQTVILAAGKGMRLRPLTDNIPKSMAMINKKPILERLLETLAAAGIKEIHMIVGYKKEIIEQKFKEKFNGMKINYFVQEKQLGTAHAVSLVEDFVEDNFLVINGDILVDPELIKGLCKADEFDLSDAKIVSIQVDDPWRYGCIKSANGKIIDIIEKPSPGQEPSHNVAVGVYKFDKLIFAAIKQINLSKRNEFELIDAIKELIKADGTVNEVKYTGYYAHIADQKDIADAEKKLKN